MLLITYFELNKDMHETPFLMDWNCVAQKFDATKISEYIFLWYDLDAKKSYEMFNDKTAGPKNKFFRMKKIITSLLSFLDDDEIIEDKPLGYTEYVVWKENMKTLSRKCSNKAFEYMKENDYIKNKTITCIDEMTVTAYINADKAKTLKDTTK